MQKTQKRVKKSGERPLVSIAIIFKNEIRCLERCLKSLQPLRDAVPSQLVMADTGSDDGSREIAEKYADILFDFPWINDFAAARNAVLDRCTGKWALVIDCDEWLDADITGLLSFLRNADSSVMVGALTGRNYKSEDLRTHYTDNVTERLFRMSGTPRYEGAIHEVMSFRAVAAKMSPRKAVMISAMLYHDGYLNLDSEAGQAKRKRNRSLLLQELEREPDNPRRILQYAESSYDQPDYLETLKHGMEVTEQKRGEWKRFGPKIFRDAVEFARLKGMDERYEWMKKAEDLFPDSYRVRIDINLWRCVDFYKQQKYEQSLLAGEKYMQAVSEFPKDIRARLEEGVSPFALQKPLYVQKIRIILTFDYRMTGRPQDALAMLKEVDVTQIQGADIPPLLQEVEMLRSKTDYDFSPLIAALWEALPRSVWDNESAEERYQAFLNVSVSMFMKSLRSKEDLTSGVALFLPLEGKCSLGDWAALMTLEDPDALSEILARQDDVTGVPAPVLLHALSYGAEFPAPDKPMTLEGMEALCKSLSAEKAALTSLALDSAQADFACDWQSLLWTDCLLFAAVSVCDWTADERRYELFRAFAAVEQVFLSRYYTAEAAERLDVLPLKHRFGWLCAQAAKSLDAGDFTSALRYLRDALRQENGMKAMIQFLLDEISRQDRERRIANTPPELLELAERVRLTLNALSPDDPAVKELKESPVYKQVSWLIDD